jgi:hypothetical protein
MMDKLLAFLDKAPDRKATTIEKISHFSVTIGKSKDDGKRKGRNLENDDGGSGNTGPGTARKKVFAHTFGAAQKALAMMPHLRSLEISCSDPDVGPKTSRNDISAIALTIVSGSELRFLDLDNVKIRSAPLKQTLRSASHLTSLRLHGDAALHAAMFKALGRSAPGTLEQLVISPEPENDEEEAMYPGPTAPLDDGHLLGIVGRVRSLKVLILRRCRKLTDVSVGRALTLYAGSLENLDLSFDWLVTDDAFAGLVKTENNLKILVLNSLTEVTDHSIVPLLEKNRRSQVWDLGLRRTNVSVSGFLRLRA